MKRYNGFILIGCIISATICFCTWLNNIIYWKSVYGNQKLLGSDYNTIFLILAILFILWIVLIIRKERDKK